ncbi:MAG: hypothetical protein ACREJC_06080 [Tepidisphaeraceae bacterium]
MQALKFAVRMVAVVSLATAGAARAAIIPLGTNSGWQAEISDSLVGLVGLPVDAQTSTTLFIEKTAQFTSLNAIDIVFRQIAPTTVNQFVILDEAVTNQSGIAWTDFHMEILGAAASFDPASTGASGGGGPIGFSIGPFTTASFSNANHNLDIAGGTVPNNTTWFPGVGPGPGNGGALYFNATPSPEEPFTVFTLREVPTVPEPGTLMFLVVGACALLRPARSLSYPQG